MPAQALIRYLKAEGVEKMISDASFGGKMIVEQTDDGLLVKCHEDGIEVERAELAKRAKVLQAICDVDAKLIPQVPQPPPRKEPAPGGSVERTVEILTAADVAPAELVIKPGR
jgi:hypothetical protein